MYTILYGIPILPFTIKSTMHTLFGMIGVLYLL